MVRGHNHHHCGHNHHHCSHHRHHCGHHRHCHNFHVSLCHFKVRQHGLPCLSNSIQEALAREVRWFWGNGRRSSYQKGKRSSSQWFLVISFQREAEDHQLLEAQGPRVFLLLRLPQPRGQAGLHLQLPEDKIFFLIQGTPGSSYR